MKKLIWIMLFTMLISAGLYSQTELHMASSLPDSLQKAIRQAEHSPNADLLYNIGVDFFRQGDAGHANLYFLRALNLNSAHKQARANLDTSLRLGQDARLYPEHLFLIRVLYQLLDFFSVNRLAVLSLLFLGLSSLALIWLLFYDPNKERALPILVLTALLLVTGFDFSALAVKSYQQSHNNKAVVVVQSMPLYPPRGNTPLFNVHAGLTVKVLNGKGQYWLVRMPDGQTGRLKAETLEKVISK